MHTHLFCPLKMFTYLHAVAVRLYQNIRRLWTRNYPFGVPANMQQNNQAALNTGYDGSAADPSESNKAGKRAAGSKTSSEKGDPLSLPVKRSHGTINAGDKDTADTKRRYSDSSHTKSNTKAPASETQDHSTDSEIELDDVFVVHMRCLDSNSATPVPQAAFLDLDKALGYALRVFKGFCAFHYDDYVYYGPKKLKNHPTQRFTARHGQTRQRLAVVDVVQVCVMDAVVDWGENEREGKEGVGKRHRGDGVGQKKGVAAKGEEELFEDLAATGRDEDASDDDYRPEDNEVNDYDGSLFYEEEDKKVLKHVG